MWSYRRCRFLYTFKITKAADKTFFSAARKIMQKIYETRKQVFFIQSELGRMILGKEN